MTRKIRFNAFDMNCVAHQSPGLWRHPDDRSWDYNTLDYWVNQLEHDARYDHADEYLTVLYKLWEGSGTECGAPGQGARCVRRPGEGALVFMSGWMGIESAPAAAKCAGRNRRIQMYVDRICPSVICIHMG
jgi:hypothetical protein